MMSNTTITTTSTPNSVGALGASNVQHVNSGSGTQNGTGLQQSVVIPGVVPSISNSTVAQPTAAVIPPSPSIGNVQSQMSSIQALAQTFQTNPAGGNIFVLNVGNATNLAATLSQLVSPNPLNAHALALLGANSQNPALPTPTTQIGTSEGTVSNSVSSAKTTTSMDIQQNLQAALLSQQMNQSMLRIPTQLQHQPQQAAGFMIVPIPPQPPQQTQPPVILNVPSQLQGNTQVQTQAQPLLIQQHQQPMNLQTVPATSHVERAPTIVQQNPRSDELRSYLMQNRTWSNSVTSQGLPLNVSPFVSSSNFVTVPNTSQTMVQIDTNSGPFAQPVTDKPPDHSQNHTTVPATQYATIPQLHPPMQTILTPSHTTTELKTVKATMPSQHEPKVSSPGLAFLAQVSSLTTGTRPATSSTLLGKGGAIEDYIINQVHASLPVLPLDDVTVGAPAGEDASISNSSMTVSSTTKIGDEMAVVVSQLPGNETTGEKTVAHTEKSHISESTKTRDGGGDELPLKRRKMMPPSSTIVREKKKKGPAPKLNGDELCLICSDKASGFHYNTLSCEGCKGFFRRTVIKGANYQCKQNGDCIMDMYMRRKCQKCRFEKCKSVGMKEESVLSEEKIKAKKLKKESETGSPSTRLLEETTIPKLTPQQRSLLELLQANERRFQWPTSEDVKKVTAWVEDDNVPHSKALRFAHFTEMCILIVQLVVEFTKQLPGFLRVLREDQIVLLKACAIEVMLLRAAKAYNKHDGTINFLNEKFYDKSSFYKAGIQVEFTEPIFTFCKSMSRLDLDETEYAILVAINTFSSDRPHIKDVETIENMQDPYVELLRLYTRIRHPDDPLMFARILMKIVELRSLNSYHSEQMFALKVQDQKLPPLLAEIWDM